MHAAPCFADLSRAELAHVRRCQFIAQAEGMAVVSSGVLAAPLPGSVASAPAGAHFWLVSGASGVVSVVWLADGRLCCGCYRRRAGALTCSHAQTVRLWLLAAAGVRVPSLSPLAPLAPEPEPEPEPEPDPPSSPSSSPAGDSSPAPEPNPAVANPAQDIYAEYEREEAERAARNYVVTLYYDEHPTLGSQVVWEGQGYWEAQKWAQGAVKSLVATNPHAYVDHTAEGTTHNAYREDFSRTGTRVGASYILVGHATVAPGAEPAPEPAPVIVATQGVICPACERPAPAGVIHDWGICAACLDDLAAAEGQPRPRRCTLLDCRELAIGETAYGAYCAKHLPHYQRMDAESAAWDRQRAEEAAALDSVVWTFDEDDAEPATAATATAEA